MKRGVFAAILVCVLLAVLSSQAMAAYEFYMHISGIDGESTSKHHEKWIEVLSWGSKSLTMPTTPTGSSGVGQFSVKHVGNTKVSPLILNLLLTNATFDMELDVVQGTKILHYILNGCHVISYSIVRSGSAPPMEEICCSFTSRSWSWGI
jgi:type VI protein secretion system component Hcp